MAKQRSEKKKKKKAAAWLVVYCLALWRIARAACAQASRKHHRIVAAYQRGGVGGAA